MNVVFKGIQYNAGVWRPAIGRVADVISYDTETTVEKDPSAVLAYVIGTVCDGKSVYFIRRQDLTAFWTVHSNCTVYFHTASFDLEVTTAACGHDFLPMIEVGLVRDISIYYRLLQCAKNGNIPQRFSLGLMCSELLGVELDKNETIRKGFGQFYHAGVINYKAVPTAYLEYATRDAIATFGLAECLEAECRVVHTQHTPLLQVGIAGTVGRSALSGRPGDVSDPQCRIEDANRPPLRHNGTYGTNGITALPWGLLGHDIQLRGDIALRAIERYGIRVDTPAVEALDQRLTAESGRHHAVLASFGYVPGKAGNQAVFNQVISQIEAERGVVIPVTPNSRKKSQAEDDLKPLADHPFVDAFLRTKDVDKIRKTYLDKLRTPDERVRPRYTLLVRTGRTSCSSPNIQNQPRDGGIRECLIPAPGHVLIACDYSMLELCTLAQLTYQRYGHSAMRELINQGVDLHRHVASMVLRKPADAVTKPERQKAKAIDFGLPGGMGVNGLREYARNSYGVELTVDEAERWRAEWLSLFPEMPQYLDGGNDLDRLGATLNIDAYPDQYAGFEPETAAAIVLRVAGGATATSSGRSFSPAELDWAWQQIADSRAGTMKDFAADIQAHKGSYELQRALPPGRTVSIPTGRVRAECSYTESRNWPFQALAADGAKLALYDLIRARYAVVAFIHDEVLVEVPEADDYRSKAEDISRIMVEAMRRVCPDVTIRTEYAVMRRWRKDAKPTYDQQGRLIPYEDAACNKVKS